MPFTFTVNNVNLLPCIAGDGLRWTRFDVEAPDTQMNLIPHPLLSKLRKIQSG